MILRRFMKHVTDQNWLAVGIDVVVVIAGVYIGILLGEVADRRVNDQEVVRLLNLLKTDLVEEIAAVDDVENRQSRSIVLYQQVIDAMSSEPVNKKAAADIITNMTGLNKTVFPNLSTYRTIQDLGHLTDIRDPKLQLMITDLFERTYKRHDKANMELSEMVLYFQRSIRDIYWDRISRDFINNNPENPIYIRNSLGKLIFQAKYYRIVLVEQVRPSLVQTIEEIDLYLEEHE